MDEVQMFTQAFWDERYSTRDHIWSGNPNQRLVEHTADLAPGSAVDVGCGEGADAVWLAQRGWQVTGVDISPVALDRARTHASEAGVAERTSWQQVDLVAGDPVPGDADLVTAQFLHVPESVFDRVYGELAAAVRPGGRLLVVGHHPADAATGLRNPELSHLLFTPEQVLDTLDLDDWEISLAETPTRDGTDHDGRHVTVTDTVVLAVKHGGH